MSTRSTNHMFQAPGPPIPQSLECKGAQRGGPAQGQAWSCLESAQQFLGCDRSAPNADFREPDSKVAESPRSTWGEAGMQYICAVMGSSRCRPALSVCRERLLADTATSATAARAVLVQACCCSRTEGDEAASQASIFHLPENSGVRLGFPSN